MGRRHDLILSSIWAREQPLQRPLVQVSYKQRRQDVEHEVSAYTFAGLSTRSHSIAVSDGTSYASLLENGASQTIIFLN